MRITVVGSINLDLVATAPRLPAPGETVTFPVAVCWHFPNVAYAVGRLGEPAPEGTPAWRPGSPVTNSRRGCR